MLRQINSAPRPFGCLSRSEQNGAYELAERHKSLLWSYCMDLAAVAPGNAHRVSELYSSRMGVTREQLEWIKEAHARSVLVP
jgi:hypothetical protein